MSPFREDRELVRNLVQKDEFIEVFIDTHLLKFVRVVTQKACIKKQSWRDKGWKYKFSLRITKINRYSYIE
ncbi:MAG: adenylyl-sulfate kinase [Sulfurimonas sp.]|nr:adenylyl-sulfate kinase [Sulfurimonas sp.]